jgi:hypothetical protein
LKKEKHPEIERVFLNLPDNPLCACYAFVDKTSTRYWKVSVRVPAFRDINVIFCVTKTKRVVDCTRYPEKYDSKSYQKMF